MPKPRATIIALWRWGASSQYRQPVVAPSPDQRADSATLGCWYGVAPTGVSISVGALCDQSGGHVLVGAHPLNAPLVRPKLLAPDYHGEEKANMLNSHSEPHAKLREVPL